MTYELLIQHQGTIMLPPVVENVSIEWERQGQPGKLIAEVVKTPGLNFQEGDPCRFSVDGTPVFYGFVFEKSRKGSTDDIIQITVYDQLYYLKNKDTYVYTNKTAADVIRMIAEDFQLNVGDLEDTGYTIGSRVEDNQTLFDIIQTALDETLKATSQMYVLYDDVGKLTLKNIGSMKLGLLIDEDTAGDFDYKSSITSQTYDKIKLSYWRKLMGMSAFAVNTRTIKTTGPPMRWPISAGSMMTDCKSMIFYEEAAQNGHFQKAALDPCGYFRAAVRGHHRHQLSGL